MIAFAFDFSMHAIMFVGWMGFAVVLVIFAVEGLSWLKERLHNRRAGVPEPEGDPESFRSGGCESRATSQHPPTRPRRKLSHSGGRPTSDPVRGWASGRGLQEEKGGEPLRGGRSREIPGQKETTPADDSRSGRDVLHHRPPPLELADEVDKLKALYEDALELACSSQANGLPGFNSKCQSPIDIDAKGCEVD